MNVTIEVKTLKDLPVQPTVWQIRQYIPRPYIAGPCFEWLDGEGLFSRYGKPPTGLEHTYTCVLLRTDVLQPGYDDMRVNHAGFRDAPGAITLRGRSLGEMTIGIRLWNPADEYWVRGRCAPSLGEAKWIQANIGDELRRLIELYKPDLEAEAIAALRVHMETRIREARKEIRTMEDQAEAALLMLTRSLHEYK